jgi:hypothetical protein
MSRCGTFTNEKLPPADFIDFDKLIPQAVMLYTSAAFVRNESNTNIVIDIPLGPDLSPGTIWYSPDTYLPNSVYNVTHPITEVIYPSGKDVQILTDLTFMHDVLIQYKITSADGTNYKNDREVRCTFVRGTGVQYDNGIFAYQMPESGQHDCLLLRGYISHSMSDLVKLRFNIVQGIGGSDTRLTIFRITWNIFGLDKTQPI